MQTLHRHIRKIAGLSWLILLAACATESDDGDIVLVEMGAKIGENCMISGDCDGGLACISIPAGRVCVQTCGDVSECGQADARCTPVSGAGVGWCDTSPPPQPPVDDPPVDDPPVDDPPVGDPAVDDPPVGDPAVDDPPVEEPEVRGDYPEGPFGKRVGDVIQNHDMLDQQGDPVTLGDLRGDPSVKLMLIFSTVTYCGGCRAKTAELTELFEELGGAGLLPIVALYENHEYLPAEGVDARQYKRSLDLDFPVVADNEAAFHIYFSERAHPMILILDAEDMTILYKQVHSRREEVESVIRERL